MSELIYTRILLKLSGEALVGEGSYGIDPQILGRLAKEIAGLVQAGTQIGLVIGGGNIFRGASLAAVGLGRVTGDHMGMLATVMNALAMQDALENLQIQSRVMSALKIGQVCEEYSQRRAIRHLNNGVVTLFAAGTGNPFFTTDSAASLRAIEINAQLLIKATKVNGIYSADPLKNPSACFYPKLTYTRAIQENLQVMDAAALVMCRDHSIPLRVLNIHDSGALLQVLTGADVGSLVTT
ncbi:uridylate kinase [Achromatium sp. WMS2]|nr:uridylate kinase [Achromatium sp. WMS2]